VKNKKKSEKEHTQLNLKKTQTLTLLDQCIFHWVLHLFHYFHCFPVRNAIDLSMIVYHSIHWNSNNQRLIENQQKHQSQCILILKLKTMISWFVLLFPEDLPQEQQHSRMLKCYYCHCWFQYPFDMIQVWRYVCSFSCCHLWICWLFLIRETKGLEKLIVIIFSSVFFLFFLGISIFLKEFVAIIFSILPNN